MLLVSFLVGGMIDIFGDEIGGLLQGDIKGEICLILMLGQGCRKGR